MNIRIYPQQPTQWNVGDSFLEANEGKIRTIINNENDTKAILSHDHRIMFLSHNFISAQDLMDFYIDTYVPEGHILQKLKIEEIILTEGN